MKEDTLRTLITLFFKYLWLVCGALIAINCFSMLSTAYTIVTESTKDALTSTGAEISRSVSVNYELLESLKDLPTIMDTSIPIQDRAIGLRPFVQPFKLWMIGVVDPDGSISSTLRYKWSKVSRDYIPRIVRTGQREMTDVFRAGATGELNYTLLVPVKRDGKVISMVFVATQLHSLKQILERKDYTSNGYFLLLDSKLNTIGHPSEELVNKSILDLMDEEKLIGSLSREQGKQLFKDRTGGSFVSLFRGDIIYTVFMPLENTPWMLIHRIRLIPTLHATLTGFSLQAGLYLLVFGALYFFGNTYILRRLAPMDAVLKQVIVLNKNIYDTDVLTDQDATMLLELSRRGLKDELTGLPTRMLFRQTLNAKLQKGLPSALCALYYMDMDNLKTINDSFGHSYGDEAIHHFGEALQQVALPYGGLCSRYGGDEFLLFVENLPDEKTAETIAAELLKALTGKVEKDGAHLGYSASIGYSLYPLQTSNIDLAIQFADIALYEAKQMGKARYTKYSINTLPA